METMKREDIPEKDLCPVCGLRIKHLPEGPGMQRRPYCKTCGDAIAERRQVSLGRFL